MQEFNRVFNESRRAQGFRSQAHLDAFFAHYDHNVACAECQKPGKGAWFDDGFQPTQNQCAVSLALYHAYLDITYGKKAVTA